MIIFSFKTIFAYHFCFLLLKNLITPVIVLNLFRYFLGKTILKNNSSQLFVLGIFSFSIKDSVASKSFSNLRRKGFISSGKKSILLFNILNLLLASSIVSCVNISDILRFKSSNSSNSFLSIRLSLFSFLFSLILSVVLSFCFRLIL